MHKMHAVARVGRVARVIPQGTTVPHGTTVSQCRTASSLKYGTEEEYLEEPCYPPVLPKEQLTKEVEKKLAWHKKITSLPTYEQKICELNMPKGYGWHCVLLDDRQFKFGGLNFLKFITRTDVEDGLPQEYYKEVGASSRVAAERLAPHVEGLVKLHFHSRANRDGNSAKGEASDFLHGLHRLLCSTLPAPPQAKTVATPRLNGFWLAGGLHHEGPDRAHWMHLKPEEREKRHWVDNLWRDREDPYMADYPIDSASHPLLSLRERAPLPPVLPRPPTSAEPRAALAHPFPSPPSSERLPPESYEYEFVFRHAKLLPGYWPGESHRHARLSYHARHYLRHTARYGASHAMPHKHISVGVEPEEQEDAEQEAAPQDTSGDAPQSAKREEPSSEQAKPADAAGLEKAKGEGAVSEASEDGKDVETKASSSVAADGLVQHRPSDPLHHQLIISAHTQALGQAGVAGFGPVTELTYPIVHHNVVSDGQTFVLSLHQCNTISLHSGNTSDLNPHRNKLWVSPEMKLWDHIEPETGEVVGLNKDLLAQLAAMYQKETVKLKDETPYLAPYKYLWNHSANNNYRVWFHEKVHILTSGRLWFRKRPELTAWERIYKLDHNTMPEENDGKKFYDPGYFQMFPANRTMQHTTPKLIRSDDRPLGKKDPINKIPIIDSVKLFNPFAKRYRNWRLF